MRTVCRSQFTPNPNEIILRAAHFRAWCENLKVELEDQAALPPGAVCLAQLTGQGASKTYTSQMAALLMRLALPVGKHAVQPARSAGKWQVAAGRHSTLADCGPLLRVLQPESGKNVPNFELRTGALLAMPRCIHAAIVVRHHHAYAAVASQQRDLSSSWRALLFCCCPHTQIPLQAHLLSSTCARPCCLTALHHPWSSSSSCQLPPCQRYQAQLQTRTWRWG